MTMRLRASPAALVWCLMLAIAAGRTVLAQTPPTNNHAQNMAPFVFRSWRAGDGLPHNSVNTIAQTAEGYLWLGTDSGLCRFDGVNCRVFGLSDGLSSLHITALLADRRGVLWIGTYGGGVSRLARGVVETLTKADGLAGNTITRLLEGADGSVWIGTKAGLSQWREGKLTRLAAPGGGTTQVSALAQDRQGTLWVATSDKGLLRLRGGKLASLPRGSPTLCAYCLLVDRQGRLWAGLREGTILCREKTGWTRYGRKEGLPSGHITSLAQTPEGTLWAGSMDGGLLYLQDGTFRALRKPDGLTDDAVQYLFVDREQNLWAGTCAGGVSRVTARRVFTRQLLDGPSETAPLSLAETSDGQLWVGTAGRGLFRWQGEAFERCLPGPPIGGYLSVRTLQAAHDGGLWVSAGMELFHWKEDQLAANYRREPRLRGDSVLSLCEEPAGALWIGTRNGQLLRLCLGQFTAVEGLAGRPVTALEQAADGTLWIGSLGAGVSSLKAGSLSAFPANRALRSNLIRKLYSDAEGTLWIGTAGGGLSRWKANRLDTFTSEQGLASDTISQILEDDAGYLWLGCNRGIMRLSKQSLEDLFAGKSSFVQPQLFGLLDGMASEECTSGSASALKTRSGQLWFCTAKGVVVMNPRQQMTNAPPTVLLEDVLINGKPQGARFGIPPSAGAVGANANSPAEIARIAPRVDRLEFRYTGLCFGAPERVRFRYRLEGLDPAWVEAGAGRVVNYGYVPPGRYKFHVIACNSEGLWNETGATAPFIVLSHFWETWWFIGLGVLVLCGASSGTIRHFERRRHQRQLWRLAMECATERERARIARDLHDELGASLTRIWRLSERAQGGQEGAEQLKTRIVKISDFALRTSRSLDEIVWAVNPRNDSVGSLLEYMTQFASELFEETGVSCRFDIPANLPEVPLPPEIRHNLFLVVKEALTNVLKHAHAREVCLCAQSCGCRLEVSVHDDGRGFEPASNPAVSGCNGLTNMQQRIKNLSGQFVVETAPGKGTTIRLAVYCDGKALEKPMG